MDQDRAPVVYTPALRRSNPITHVVLLSGGLGSWAAGKRVAEMYGTDNLILLFHDTHMEDEDLYRFIKEAAENIGGTFLNVSDARKRTPWDVFFDVRFLGNTRVDPCSRVLKRDISDEFFALNFTPGNCVRYCGIDWTEEHRFIRMRDRIRPWIVDAPLCHPPYLTKKQIKDWAASEGLKIPRLYDLGFDHNNCGGMCVKMGQAQAAHALKVIPDVYLMWEQKEQDFIKFIGKPVSILRDRRKSAETTVLTLRDFRLRLEAGEQYDCHEWGGCSCFAGPPDEELQQI